MTGRSGHFRFWNSMIHQSCACDEQFPVTFELTRRNVLVTSALVTRISRRPDPPLRFPRLPQWIMYYSAKQWHVRERLHRQARAVRPITLYCRTGVNQELLNFRISTMYSDGSSKSWIHVDLSDVVKKILVKRCILKYERRQNWALLWDKSNTFWTILFIYALKRQVNAE